MLRQLRRQTTCDDTPATPSHLAHQGCFSSLSAVGSSGSLPGTRRGLKRWTGPAAGNFASLAPLPPTLQLELEVSRPARFARDTKSRQATDPPRLGSGTAGRPPPAARWRPGVPSPGRAGPIRSRGWSVSTRGEARSSWLRDGADWPVDCQSSPLSQIRGKRPPLRGKRPPLRTRRARSLQPRRCLSTWTLTCADKQVGSPSCSCPSSPPPMRLKCNFIMVLCRFVTCKIAI
jgi:hypothetical protein